jgi:hypothetical protein
MFCIDLTLPFQPLLPNVQLEKRHANLDRSTQVTPELLAWVNDLGLEVQVFESFYCYPNKTGGIHTDAQGGDITKINWIVCDGASTMNWYAVKDSVVKHPKPNSLNTLYTTYDPNEVTLVHSQEVKFPSIVQAGVPHDITNGNNDRWCLSLVLAKNNKRIKMSTALEIFKPWIK